MKRLWRNADICVYVLFALFYLWLAEQVPYTHDDWDWGLPVGIQQLLTANLNSRYVGNFFEVVMTRSEVLKTIIMGAGYFLLPFGAAYIAAESAGKKHDMTRLIGFAASNVLLLTMDRGVWRQTYGWVAGYANFGLSALFMLTNIWLGLSVFSEDSLPDRRFRKRDIGLFFLSFAGQLFIENLALFMVAYYLVISVVYYLRTRSIGSRYCFQAAGGVLGLAVMFSSNMYATLWNQGESLSGVRHLQFAGNTGLLDSIINCIRQAVNHPVRIWENNLILSVSILVVLTVLIVLSPRKKAVRYVCAAANVLFYCYFILNHALNIVNGKWYTCVMNLLFFAAAAVQIVVLYHDRRWYMCKLLLLWISAPVVILPLAATNELGPRLYMTSNALLLLFFVHLMYDVLKRMPAADCRKLMAFGLSAVMLLACCHGQIYAAIGACKQERAQIIAEAVESGQKRIILPQFPYPEYLWNPNPVKEWRWVCFKDFYGIPRDADVMIWY